MIGLHYYYFFVTCIHFVKLGNAFPQSLDKKDFLERAGGSSDTIVSLEYQYRKVPNTAKLIFVMARSNAVNHIAAGLLLFDMEPRHSGVLEEYRNVSGFPKHCK